MLSHYLQELLSNKKYNIKRNRGMCVDTSFSLFFNEEKASIALDVYGTGSAFDRIVVFEEQELPKSMNTDEENLEHFKKSLKNLWGYGWIFGKIDIIEGGISTWKL